MGQPSSVWSSDVAVDTTISGPKARPDRGRGATFEDPGDLASAVDPEAVVSAFQAIFDEAYRYRLTTCEADWITNYQQYHGETGDPGKAEWQSQVHVPVSAQACDTAAGKITSVMFGQEDWFTTRAASRSTDGRAERAKKMLIWQFDKAQAQDPINQSVKDAMICGNGILKVHVANEVTKTVDTKWTKNLPGIFMDQPIDMGGKWEFTESKKAVKRMRFESLIPTDMWLDPSGQSRFKIQRIKRSISDLWALAKDQKGDDGKTVIRKAVYDPKAIAMVRAGSRDSRLDSQASIIRHEKPMNFSQQMVDVYEFWGDLPDPTTGAILYENVFFTLVNKQFLIRPPQRNPYLHRADPFIWIPGRLLPHQIYGYGLLGQTAKLQAELDRTLQLMVDRMHLCVPMYEVDDTKLRNPEQVQGDHVRFAPGKIFKTKRGGDQNSSVFKATDTAQPLNEWEVQVYQLILQAFQMFANNNEWATGNPQSTQRKTKVEVQARSSAAQENYNEAAQYIEQIALTPLVNMVYKLMIQFEDQYDDQELLDQFADSPEDRQALLALANMSAEERWNAMKLDTEFEVNGVTRDITRQARIQRIQTFMQMAGADPTLGQLIDKAWLLRELLADLDLPKGLVLKQADAILQAVQQQMLMMMGQPPDAEAQPGAPPGTAEQTPGQLAAGQNQHNSRTQSGASARQPPPEAGGVQ